MAERIRHSYTLDDTPRARERNRDASLHVLGQRRLGPDLVRRKLGMIRQRHHRVGPEVQCNKGTLQAEEVISTPYAGSLSTQSFRSIRGGAR